MLIADFWSNVKRPDALPVAYLHNDVSRGRFAGQFNVFMSFMVRRTAALNTEGLDGLPNGVSRGGTAGHSLTTNIRNSRI